MKRIAKRKSGMVMLSLACVMTLALTESRATGQPIARKLLASDGVIDDFFGTSVAISGAPGNEVAIVGASGDDDNGGNAGAAYIFRKVGGTWVEEQKLLASDGASLDTFGGAVAISGAPGNEVAIVGAFLDANSGIFTGSAYIFRFNGVSWVEEDKLLASDGLGNDSFGISVSISGAAGNEFAIIGASGVDDSGNGSGAAYVFRFNGVSWDEEDKLLATDGAASDDFGFSVSCSGAPGNEVAIVGAKDNDDTDANAGSAYIYRKTGASWVEEDNLLASDGAANDFFGYSVSISGAPGSEVAIVGAYRDDDNAADSGSAYIYRFNGAAWGNEQKITASDGAADDWFGFSVSISGGPGEEFAIVGAYQDDDFGGSSGSAYIYRFNPITLSWVEEDKALAPDSAANDQFGKSVSISGDFAIVGSSLDDDKGDRSGSAYIFTGLLISVLSGDCNSNGINDLSDIFLHKTSTDCNDNGIPDECDIASGASLDIDVDDIPDECLASCPPDVNGDGAVNVTDLLALLAAWGVCP